MSDSEHASAPIFVSVPLTMSAARSLLTLAGGVAFDDSSWQSSFIAI
jgi:hypothetical protein